jgi:hypothetical protein
VNPVLPVAVAFMLPLPAQAVTLVTIEVNFIVLPTQGSIDAGEGPGLLLLQDVVIIATIKIRKIQAVLIDNLCIEVVYFLIATLC